MISAIKGGVLWPMSKPIQPQRMSSRNQLRDIKETHASDNVFRQIDEIIDSARDESNNTAPMRSPHSKDNAFNLYQHEETKDEESYMRFKTHS